MLHTDSNATRALTTSGKRLALRGAACAIATLVVAVGALACRSNPPAAPKITPAAVVNQPVVQPQPQAATHYPFDGDAAYASIKKQCDFGPRVIGTQAHEKCLAYLLDEMRKYADETFTQKFNFLTSTQRLPNTNVVGVFYAAGSTKPSTHPILLMAHWDTRPIADGPYSAESKRGVAFRFSGGNWTPTAPIPGADDAGSGVAILIEMAKQFKAHKPPVGVVMLLDDGEDYGDFEANGNAGEGVELGARYFAQHYKETPAFGQPAYGILLDMVGASNAFFPRESISQERARVANDKVFGAAEALGYGSIFPSNRTQAVGDDHVSVNDAGIPTIDIIHPLPFGEYLETGYTYWHTTQDTPDKCSAKTLKIVGEVVESVIYSETP